MRILILTADIPYPPASGGALRAYGLLKGLADAGHGITLLTFGNPSAQIETPLSDLCEDIIVVAPPHRPISARLIDFISGKTDLARRLFSDAFERKLQELLRRNQFDIVQFEGIEIACYLPQIAREQHRPLLVFDNFNAEAALQRMFYTIDRSDIKRLPAALYSWVQSRRIARYERDLCQMADAVIAVSDEDAAILSDYGLNKRIDVVPSGVFVDDYVAPPASTRDQSTLVFTGKMDYRPNIDAVLWFVDDIMPALNNATFVIVGQQPHPRIQHLASRHNINITGRVDSVLPYLQRATVYVAPLRMGSGTRLKLLEALASGCAIVATTTAAAGLTPDVKAAMCIEDDAGNFSHAVSDLLKDDEKRISQGAAGRRAVSQHYDWQVIIPRLLDIYERLTGG